MKTLAAAIALVLLGAMAPGVRADPEETDPDAAKRDEDYAAGKKALEEICLLPCEELTDLERAVAAYRAKR